MLERVFTIVIPLYNKEDYIDRALQSVLAQPYNNYEVIVVDDGSTDKGPDIVKEINDPRVRLIQQINAGVSAARNKGIEEAKGDLIAFLDADDEWMPEYLETILELKAEYPEAGIYAMAYNEVMTDGKVRNTTSSNAEQIIITRLLHNYFHAALIGEAALHVSAIAVPKHIFRELGGFLQGVPLGEDLELFCRIAIRYPVAWSNRVGAIYYCDVINSAMKLTLHIDELSFVKTARSAIEDGLVPTDMINDLKEFIAEHQLFNAQLKVITGNKLFARKLLKDCHTKLFVKRKLWWSFWASMPVIITRSAYKINKKVKQIFLIN